MGKYTVKLVDKKVDRLLYDLVYKQNGVHVEDADGNIIGHIYNDNANFLRNFAAKFGVDLNTLVPYIPGQKALWNFIENRFFKLTLLNKTIASKTVQYALGKKIKAATLKAVGAAMGLAESKILDLITSNNMVVTAEEEAQITQLMNVKNSNDATSVEIDGTTIAVDSSSEDLGMLEQAVNHYVSLFKVNFNETVEKIVGTVANLAAAELAEKALNVAETATQTLVGFGATLLNPSYGVIALLSLKADNELNSDDTYSKSIVQWLVGYDAHKENLENRSSNFASQMLQKILPNFLQATSTDYDNAYGKLVSTTDGEWEIIGRDASTIVSMTKVVEGIQSSFGNIASGFGESVKNIFGNAVKNLEKVVETGKDIVSTVAEVAENLVKDLPAVGHNIYDAEPGYDEEVQPDFTDKLIAKVSSWLYGSK